MRNTHNPLASTILNFSFFASCFSLQIHFLVPVEGRGYLSAHYPPLSKPQLLPTPERARSASPLPATALIGGLEPGLVFGTTVFSDPSGFMVARALELRDSGAACDRDSVLHSLASECLLLLASIRSPPLRQIFFSVSFILDLAAWLALVRGLAVAVP